MQLDQFLLQGVTMASEVNSKVREFIKDNFMYRDDRADLADTESLLDAGLIDSTGILELVAFIETEFSIQMSDSDIVPDNLDSVDTIVRYVESKRVTV
jgi:acyl carrier protein